ncbi:MAG: sigma-70 family RNA polymerase sigma factor [Planctomycetota bacterium]|nr:MAG: sigma-70 family RNA polymerase sigma factor [Planctomycetota bacterium]
MAIQELSPNPNTRISDAQLPIDVESLVTAAQTGDERAFEILFDAFHGMVRSTVRAVLRDEVEAQEAVQEVFIQAYRKLDQLTDGSKFPGWLRTIANRMAINRAVRGKRHRMLSGEFLDSEPCNGTSPLADMLAAERCEVVRQGLERLGTLDRDTLEAFYFDGQSLAEMSRRFDSPIGTIKRRLHVARKRLAREIEPLLTS